MLAANQCCALYLKTHKLPGIHRIHEPPESEDIRQFFRAFKGTHSQFSGNKIIERAKQSRKNRHDDLRNLYVEALATTKSQTPASQQLHQKILKSMKKAAYSKSDKGHFALGFDDYAHFTSPIRRFPDLWNHKLIKMSLAGRKINSSMKLKAAAIAESTSEIEIEVMKLERRGNRCASAWILGNYIGARFKGVVSNLDNVGISIFLDYNFIYGDVWVPLSKLKDDYYIFDERTQSLNGKRTHRKIHLEDKVNLKLISTDPVLGRTDFEITTA